MTTSFVSTRAVRADSGLFIYAFGNYQTGEGCDHPKGPASPRGESGCVSEVHGLRRGSSLAMHRAQANFSLARFRHSSCAFALSSTGRVRSQKSRFQNGWPTLPRHSI
jgi:hypothetical protein